MPGDTDPIKLLANVQFEIFEPPEGMAWPLTINNSSIRQLDGHPCFHALSHRRYARNRLPAQKCYFTGLHFCVQDAVVYPERADIANLFVDDISQPIGFGFGEVSKIDVGEKLRVLPAPIVAGCNVSLTPEAVEDDPSGDERESGRRYIAQKDCQNL